MPDCFLTVAERSDLTLARQQSRALTNKGIRGCACHDSGLSLGLKLTHCFMLMTWLFSVSRSMRAAVR
jgi:hypothetical protein